jgi:hypothetical protein
MYRLRFRTAVLGLLAFTDAAGASDDIEHQAIARLAANGDSAIPVTLGGHASSKR